jgi:hypothetical protein
MDRGQAEGTSTESALEDEMILETLRSPPFVASSIARKALSRVYLMFRYINIRRGGRESGAKEIKINI